MTVRRWILGGASIWQVRHVFKHAGCTDKQLQSILYHHCAMEMYNKRASFIEMPVNRTFPSSHHFYIHMDELEGAIKEGRVKWADDEARSAPAASPTA